MAGPEQLRAVLRLMLADGVGAITYGKLVAAFGGAASAVAAGASQWRKVDGIGEKTATAMSAVTDQDVEQEIALAGEKGVRIICLGDEDYPPGLMHIHDPPPALYVLGQFTPADAVALSVVGSRRCTHYGMEQAGRFGGLLGRAGFTVISGGARGIDSAAHRGALDAGGRTIAVMGCGLCQMYPPENRPLFEQIIGAGQGCLITELPMRTDVKPGNFPNRNRIISGLSLGVLVVEAALKSGSLITARLAVEQGKEVFALPGRVDSPFSQGTNTLIAKGSAALVQNLDDILNALGSVGQAMEKAGSSAAVEGLLPTGGTLQRPALNPVETQLAELLALGELSLDELIRRSGLPIAQVTSTMTMLAIKGVVAQKSGGIFAARRASP